MTKGEVYNDSVLFMGLTPANGFQAGTLYSYKPINGDGDFVSTRASSAYRVASDGTFELMGTNEPRIDYANTCPELLVENEATNDILYSRDISNAAWGKLNMTTPTATKAVPTVTNAAHRLEQNVASVGVLQAMSVWALADGYNWIALEFDGQVAYFNVSTGVIGTVSGGTASIKFEGGYWKCTLILTPSNNKSYVYVANADNNLSFAGDGTSGVQIGGVQVEDTIDTSLILTTGTAATRSQDLIENNAVDYTLDEATFFIRARLDFTETVKGIFSLRDNSVLDDYIAMYYVQSGGDNFITLETYTNPDTNVINVQVFDDGICNIAVAYDLIGATYSIALNGTIIDSGTFANAVPTSNVLTNFVLGRLATYGDSRTIMATFFDSKLSDTDLENITA